MHISLVGRVYIEQQVNPLSAIVGRINLLGKAVDVEIFSKALSALGPYGVDGSAVLNGDHFKLGIQCLNLSDRAPSELSPQQSGSTSMVADLVLNDRNALGEALGNNAVDVEELSDIMLLQQSYRKWGDNCPNHISGDFAFAVYNQEQRRLFLTRDHIGTRPLYWAKRDDTVIFATDIRAILANTDFDWPVDEETVAHYLVHSPQSLPDTFFEGINSVPPATAVIIDASGTQETEWWSPHTIPEFKYESQEDYISHFRTLMETIGREYTASPGNIGTHFSGGIDSFSVAALAHKALKPQGRNLTAGYSWSPPVSEDYPILGNRDERHVIQTLSEKLGLPVRYGAADGLNTYRYLELEIELDGVADLMDELPVLEAAKTDGVRVMLSGWGGDEAYSAHGIGYLSYTIKTLRFREMRKALQIHTGARRFRPLKTVRAFFSWGLVPMFPNALFRRFTPIKETHDESAFPNSAMKAIAAELDLSGEKGIRLVSDPRVFLANLIKLGHLNMRMETWAAWSSEFGFQYRYPLLDRRIIEFVLGMPRQLFMADGQNRYLAHQVIKDLVPEGLRKYDPANELFRNSSRLECWRLLQKDLSENVFAGDSAWLNMEDLREAIDNVPENVELNQIQFAAKIYAAVRIWKMEQRFKSSYQRQRWE